MFSKASSNSSMTTQGWCARKCVILREKHSIVTITWANAPWRSFWVSNQISSPVTHYTAYVTFFSNAISFDCNWDLVMQLLLPKIAHFDFTFHVCAVSTSHAIRNSFFLHSYCRFISIIVRLITNADFLLPLAYFFFFFLLYNAFNLQLLQFYFFVKINWKLKSECAVQF